MNNKGENMREGTLTLTQEEGSAMIDLIDIALKANGLKSAQNCLVLVNKIQLAFQAQVDETPTEFPTPKKKKG